MTGPLDSSWQVAEGREEEEQLLEAVREALGAKHVIRVCSSYEQVSWPAGSLRGWPAGLRHKPTQARHTQQ